MGWHEALTTFVSKNIVELGTKEPHHAADVPVTVTPAIPGIPGITRIPTSVAVPEAATPPIGVIDPALNSSFIEKLRTKFSNSPLYPVTVSFNKLLGTLQEFIPEEGQRFRAALKQLEGVDADKLREAYASFSVVLDTETNSFGKALAQRKEAEVTAREQSVEQINAQIKVLMDKRDGIAGEIVQARTKMSAADSSFQGAIVTLRYEIEDTVRKLNIYVPAVSSANKGS